MVSKNAMVGSLEQRAALRRVARLQSQRGAAVFIVVMVMTLLAAVGIFAVRSASMADMAAGFDREGAQASLVAQYGVTATAVYLGTNGLSSTVVNAMRTKWAKCEANGVSPAVPSTPVNGCYRVRQVEDIQTQTLANSNEVLFAPSNAAVPNAYATSSLNARETTDAAFLVELTEANETGVPIAGEAGGGAHGAHMKQYGITVTSMAQIRPAGACPGGVGITPPNAAQTAVRSVLTVGAITL